MLLVAVVSIPFGGVVDRHHKHRVMIASSLVTLTAYALAGGLFLLVDTRSLVDWTGPWFWVFTLLVLAGGVVEQLRNIALSTTVTLLVPDGERDRANGLVGAAQGLAFMATSALSGLSVGRLGMGWTMVLALVATAGALAHLLTLRIPERGCSTTPSAARSRSTWPAAWPRSARSARCPVCSR